MSKLIPNRRHTLRILTTAGGIVLLSLLLWRAGPSKLVEDVVRLRWGILLVLALGGVPHGLKAWAWRFTLLKEARKTTFSQLLRLRLASEAVGNFGAFGQLFGEGIRITALTPDIPAVSRISSVVLDRALFILTGAVVTLIGVVALLFDRSLHGALKSYAELLVLFVVAFLVAVGLTVRRRWRPLSHSALFLRKFRFLARTIESKRELVESVEHSLLGFYSADRRAFWASLGLNFLCQAMTTVELYVILLLMGASLGVLGAFIFDALVKLVNVVGTVNPGNIGTYEAGTVLIAGMFKIGATVGLAVAVTRRLRALFWSAIGAACLMVSSRRKRENEVSEMARLQSGEASASQSNSEVLSSSAPPAFTAIILLNAAQKIQSGAGQFTVGTLPVALRLVLALEKAGVNRIVLSIDPAIAPWLKPQLTRTKRLPACVEWYEIGNGRSLCGLLRSVAVERPHNTIILARGDTTYHPALVRGLIGWDGGNGALAVTSGEQFAGICVLSSRVAKEVAETAPTPCDTLDQLHDLLASTYAVESRRVPEDSWQRVSTPREQAIAENKLNGWLVKATDGVFARMNRKISIPISRQLILWPITPNMVSIFTLGVGIVSGTFFAIGGYWNVLMGALLSVWASILDGCDGEVARLKLQESDFGCWLETICDYLYYLCIFSGMAIGLIRAHGTAYSAWTAVLLFGAVTSFLVTGIGRHRLASAHPEQYLRIWQARAESRRSNPILYFGRHCEFMIRRCFMPYALLGFALLNMTKVVFILAALGANLVWFISLYSYRTFAITATPPEAALDGGPHTHVARI